MTEAAIRPYKEEDRRALIQILSGSAPWTTLGYGAADWDKYWSPLPSGREAFVIECDGRVAGVAVLRPKFLFGDYLELFAVADWARGRALGSRLLQHIERVAFARGTNLLACVSDFNQAARAFYAKHGYREVGALTELLVPGAGEILLRKTTGPARAGVQKGSS
ncbi:MAG: GNAT family N-acetyltransferase [Nitrospiraceae bacterium]